jgi:hypothetical protein
LVAIDGPSIAAFAAEQIEARTAAVALDPSVDFIGLSAVLPHGREDCFAHVSRQPPRLASLADDDELARFSGCQAGTSGTVKPNSPRGRGILGFLRFAIGVCASSKLVSNGGTNCMINNFFEALLDGTIMTGAMYHK